MLICLYDLHGWKSFRADGWPPINWFLSDCAQFSWVCKALRQSSLWPEGIPGHECKVQCGLNFIVKTSILVKFQHWHLIFDIIEYFPLWRHFICMVRWLECFELSMTLSGRLISFECSLIFSSKLFFSITTTKQFSWFFLMTSSEVSFPSLLLWIS